ncbi:hypothetical protein AA0473_0512 [Acetobacter orleanensis NRIC 0473]|nr:hypothetical protein AA0473_0512 [Acetobacter orleanensis NRIC 0473]
MLWPLGSAPQLRVYLPTQNQTPRTVHTQPNADFMLHAVRQARKGGQSQTILCACHVGLIRQNGSEKFAKSRINFRSFYNAFLRRVLPYPAP